MNVAIKQTVTFLSANRWRTVKLVSRGDTVNMSADHVWSRRLTRPNSAATKRKLLWRQNAGTEIDHVIVSPTR